MSVKDVRKMKRQDLLELLILQSKDVAYLTSDLKEKNASIAEMEETFSRLREKLNDKDTQMEHLKEKLNLKDAQIEHLKERLDHKDAQIAELENRIAAGTVAGEENPDVNLVMDKLYDAAQTAVRQYMKQHERSEAEETQAMKEQQEKV